MNVQNENKLSQTDYEWFTLIVMAKKIHYKTNMERNMNFVKCSEKIVQTRVSKILLNHIPGKYEKSSAKSCPTKTRKMKKNSNITRQKKIVFEIILDK